MRSCELSELKSFKGVSIVSQRLYRVEFDSLDSYSVFKRSVYAVNCAFDDYARAKENVSEY